MADVMKQAVFAKKRTSRDGKTFYSYLTTMRRKDGTEEIVQLKFRDKCGAPDPDQCPQNIVFPKSAANYSKRTFTREDTGEIVEQGVIWISQWDEGEPYVDTSMDDFE